MTATAQAVPSESLARPPVTCSVYAAGSDGPAEASTLLEGSGRRWWPVAPDGEEEQHR